MSDKSHIRHYNADDVKRLKELVREGCTVFQEIEDLQGGLNDTIKAIAEEMGINSGVLKKAVKTAHKNTLGEERRKFEELEDILTTLGVGEPQDPR
jgi:transposase-like protein